MFLSMKRMPPLSGGRGQGLRSIALVLVLCAVAYGFWKNSERQVELIGQRGMVMDDAGVLSRDELGKLRELALALKENYGVKTLVTTSRDEIVWPEEGAAALELFIAVSPSRKEAVLSFSPLLCRGLGEEFCYNLQHEVLEAKLREGRTFEALSESLSRIWHQLGSIS